MKISLLLSVSLSLAFTTLSATAQNFGFSLELKSDLSPEFSETPFQRAAGDLDGDGLPDVALITTRHLGVLLNPGPYIIHEMVDTDLHDLEDLAILENLADHSGSTLFVVGGGEFRAFRYTDTPTPGIVPVGPAASTTATSVATWSGNYSATTYGFVALAEASTVRVMMYFQSTGVYFVDAFTASVAADEVALADLNADGQPELIAFNATGAHQFDSSGNLVAVHQGDFSSIKDRLVLRHTKSAPMPIPEVAVWTVDQGADTHIWQLSSNAFRQDTVANVLSAGVSVVDYDQDGYLDVFALGDNGSWTIGTYDPNDNDIDWGQASGATHARSELAPPVVDDLDGDGDYDLLTFSANADQIRSPDEVDAGPDVHLWTNDFIDATIKKAAILPGEMTITTGSGGGGQGPSAMTDATVTIQLRLEPPSDASSMDFDRVVVRSWTGAMAEEGVEHLIVEAEYDQGTFALTPAQITAWTTRETLALPGDGTLIDEDLSSSSFTDGGWEFSWEIPLAELAYFQVFCAKSSSEPDLDFEAVYPSEFYVLNIDENDSVWSLLWQAFLEWHGGSVSTTTMWTVDSDTAMDPYPTLFRIEGLTLRICGYPVGTT